MKGNGAAKPKDTWRRRRRFGQKRAQGLEKTDEDGSKSYSDKLKNILKYIDRNDFM